MALAESHGSERREVLDGREADLDQSFGRYRFAAASSGGGLDDRTVRAAGPADGQHFDEPFRPILVRYCVGCHGGEKPKGKLGLDRLTTDFSDAADRERRSAVIDRLKTGEMPPEGKPRPSAQEVQSLVDWLGPRLEAAERAGPAAGGRAILRRLNRVEYENTIRDLLGIHINLKEQLPSDGAADGFDNAGAANHTSSFLMEKYLEAAETALALAIANRPKPPPASSKRHSLKDGYPVRGSTENVYRFLNDGEVVCFCSSEWHNVGATRVLSVRGWQLSVSDLGISLPERWQTCNLSGNCKRHEADRKKRSGRLLRRACRQASCDRVRALYGAADDDHDAAIRSGGRGHRAQGRRREVEPTGAGRAIHRRGRTTESDLAARKP